MFCLNSVNFGGVIVYLDYLLLKNSVLLNEEVFADSVWVSDIIWHVQLPSRRKPGQTDQQRQAVNERVYFCFIVEVTAITSLSSATVYCYRGGHLT